MPILSSSQSTLRLDWETRSDIDLTARGVYVYCESPYTDALLASYRINDEPLRRWKRGEPCPEDIREHVLNGGLIRAFNAAFERMIWWMVMYPKHGWPKPALEQFRDTAVEAAAMSLPRSLERLGDALDLKVKKDKRGKALMKIHSIPVGFTETGVPIWHEKADDPISMGEYHTYCDFDVLTEEGAEKRLVPLSEYEWEIYALSERINDRGLRIDTRSARAALQLIERAEEKLNRELKFLTAGAVTAVTQIAALTRWLLAQGFELTSLDKETIEDFLFEYEDIPVVVRRALEIRQAGAKAAVKKIAAMLDRVGVDGRARGSYLHHGAGQTGRFSARVVHNMPKYRKEFEAAKLRLDVLFATIRTGDPDACNMMYGDKLGQPLHLLADATRSFIWAAPGHRLIDVDYSSIEGRMAAWFARENWKLDAYRALDRGEGFGLYELTAARIYNIPPEDVDKTKRATGKVAELALGYQSGVGGLSKMARQNKLKLASVFGPIWESAPADRRDAAIERYEDRLKHHDEATVLLGKDGWLAAELIKVGWRLAHPNIVSAWKALEEAAVTVVEDYENRVAEIRASLLLKGRDALEADRTARTACTAPGTISTALNGTARYLVAHGFLWLRLPSGRCLAYGAPRMQETEAPWADKTLEPRKREKKRSLTVKGTDPQTEKWVRFPIYGGSCFNNLVQGSARDVLVHGMLNAEAAGYPIVLHTHDEMAAEVPNDWGSVEELTRVANDLPVWTTDLPLTASGWVGKRYRKD